MTPQPDSSGNRTKPTARESWIALLVLGIATAVVGITSPLLAPVIEVPPLLTLIVIAVGATIIIVSGVRLSRLANTDDPETPPH